MSDIPPKKKAPRRGRAVKSANGAAATLEPGSAAAPKGFDAGKVADELNLWWENGDGTNFILGDPQGWSRWPQTALVNLLRTHYVRIKKGDGEFLSQVETTLLQVMRERRLELVLPSLSGYPSGIYEMSGKRVLVKTSPLKVEPRAGDWGMVRALIESKLDLSKDEEGNARGGPNQTAYFHAWCKVALEGLYLGGPGNFRPGQCLIFAGKRNCGKSRLQHQVITGLLGGRSADPGPYLFGRTDFNGELFEAEHLMMEDPSSSTTTKERVFFGEMIKQFVVNDTQRMHDKRERAVTCSPFHRMSISVNDDPDKLRVLPLLTPDIRDKLMLFLVSDAPLPMPTTSLGERAAFRSRIDAELPCYAHWLLNEFVIPEGMRSERFGVKEWLHPALALELFDDTPAAELLQIIDAALLADKPLWDIASDGNLGTTWEGTALELEALLLGNVPDYPSTVVSEMKKWTMHNKLDRALARLEQDRDDRVAKHRTNTARNWIIAKRPE